MMLLMTRLRTLMFCSAGPYSPALVMEFLPHGDLKNFLTVSVTL